MHLEYSPNLHDVLIRLRRLYAREATDEVMAVMQTPSTALKQFAEAYPAGGYCEYPSMDDRLAFWTEHLARKADVQDDSVPSAYLTECDQGLYGGMVGGAVRYMAHPENGWISSMVKPVFDGSDQLPELSIDYGTTAWQRYLTQLEAFAQAAQGRFGISHFILIDSLNFMFELFGATHAYWVTIQQPDLTERLCRFAYELNVEVQDRFFASTGLLEGGTCSNMGQWVPGRIVSESVDPFHMTSVEDFERWGHGWVERVLAYYDGGLIHIHANGRHLLKAIASISGLRGIWLGDDRGFPRSFEVLGEIRNLVADVPLIVQCRYDEFADALARHRLVGGVLYEVSDVPDSDSANRTMEAVRRYRA